MGLAVQFRILVAHLGPVQVSHQLDAPGGDRQVLLELLELFDDLLGEAAVDQAQQAAQVVGAVHGLGDLHLEFRAPPNHQIVGFVLAGEEREQSTRVVVDQAHLDGAFRKLGRRVEEIVRRNGGQIETELSQEAELRGGSGGGWHGCSP